MNVIQLLATDLDGTLIGSATEFPLYNSYREKVTELKRNYNTIWVACTGRDLSSFKRFFSPMRSMGMEPDGLFPRDPEPTARNLRDLGELVRSSGSEIGLAVDPDVDRLSLVDEGGEPIGEDFTLALAVSVVLAGSPGPVVTNLSTSQVVEDAAREFGCQVIEQCAELLF